MLMFYILLAAVKCYSIQHNSVSIYNRNEKNYAILIDRLLDFVYFFSRKISVIRSNVINLNMRKIYFWQMILQRNTTKSLP